MRWHAALLIYRMALPLLFVAAFPGWIIRMLRRGGLGTRLGERLAIYDGPPDFEPSGAIHIHAVSVGETLLGLKLIRAWQARGCGSHFVLATGTATGHAVATAAALVGVRVTYSPLDLPSMVRRYLGRFEPSQLVLIEGEAWPHLLLACRKRRIPVVLVNARMSPRSARRYRRFADWLRPLFSMLDAVAIQQAEDAAVWEDLGVSASRIHHTGSLKIDPGSGAPPARRAEFQNMLDAFDRRPVILAASTHAGEDAWIAQAVRTASPAALIVLVPRHAERRAEVLAELSAIGVAGVLRSTWNPAAPRRDPHEVFVIDSTGELRDWTAHADVVIIGKSFLADGGQNPTEAVLAGKPVVFGPHMENFEPLATRFVDAGGAIRAMDRDSLVDAIRRALDPLEAARMTAAATAVIRLHSGATERIIDLLEHAKTMAK